MKKLLSTLLVVALLAMCLAPAALAEELKTCTTDGFTYEVPASWRFAQGETENIAYYYYDNGVSSMESMLMVMTVDVSEYASLMSVLPEQDLYEAMGSGIVQSFGSGATVDTTLVTIGDMRGAYYDISLATMTIGGFATMQDTKLVAVMLVDLSLSKEEIKAKVTEISLTLRVAGAEQPAAQTEPQETAAAPVEGTQDILSDLNNLSGLDSLLGRGTTETAAPAVEENRTAYTTCGFSYTLPDSWKVSATNDNNVTYDMNSGAMLSMFMVLVQDATDMMQYIDILGMEQVYSIMANSLGENFGGSVTNEAATVANMEGAMFVIDMGIARIHAFMTLQNNAFVVLMTADTNMSDAELVQVIEDVARTLTW